MGDVDNTAVEGPKLTEEKVAEKGRYSAGCRYCTYGNVYGSVAIVLTAAHCCWPRA